MNETLLDTDLYSEILRSPNSTVASRALAYRRFHGRLTVSVITVMEMVKGLQQIKSHPGIQRTQRIDSFLHQITLEHVLGFDRRAAELAGRVWGDLQRTGQPIGMADPMIAAIALTHGLELASGNTSHYQRIQHLGYPLVLVNWRH